MVKSLRLVTFFAVIIFAASYFCLPHLEDFIPSFESVSSKEYIEQALTYYFKQPVQVRNMSLHWQGFHPILGLNDFAIKDSNGFVALKVKRIEIGIDLLASFLNGKINIGAVLLQGASLSINELGNGIIIINNIKALQANLNEVHSEKLAMLLNIFLANGTKQAKDINIAWYDKAGHLILPLSNLNFSAQSNFLVHQFKGNVKMENGSSIEVDGRVYGSYLAKHFLYSNVNLHAAHVELNNNALLTHLVNNVRLKGGKANIQLALKMRPTHSMQAKGSIQADNLFVQSQNALYSLNHFQTYFRISHEPCFWRIAFQELQLNLNNKLLPINKFSLEQSVNGQHSKRTIKVDNLPIQQVLGFISDNHLLSAKINDWANCLQPTGEIKKFTLQLEGKSQEATQISMSGYLNHISFSSWGQFPGIQNLNGELNFSPQGGDFTLNTFNTILKYNSLFQGNIPLLAAKARVNWRQDASRNWQINIENYHLKTRDGQALGYMNLFLPRDFKNPQIHSKANFEITDISHISRYYPVRVMPAGVINWLNTSIKGGVLKNGSFLLDGCMRDFPFTKSKGKFLITGDLQKGRLYYLNGWPQVDDIKANLRFEGHSMFISSSQAKLLGAKATCVQARIDDLVKPALRLQGQLDALPHSRTLLTRENNPLAKFSWFTSFHPLLINGQWQLALKLYLPFDEDPKFKTLVNGKLNLNDVTILSKDSSLLVGKLKGKVTFSEDCAQSNLLIGNLFSNPFKLSIMTEEDQQKRKVTLMNLDSSITIPNLKKISSLSFLDYFQGTIPFHAKLSIIPKNKDKSTSLTVMSNLKGLESHLPAPLDKATTTIIPSAFQINQNNQGAHAKFNYGKTINGELVYQTHFGSFKFQSGEINFNHPVKLRGNISIPSSYPTLPIKANFQKMIIEDNAASNRLSPQDIPSLDLYIAALQYKDKSLKNVSIKLRPENNHVLIKQAAINEPMIKLSASGIWQGLGAHQETILSGKFSSNNLGAMLNQWHITENVVKGQGKLILI